MKSDSKYHSALSFFSGGLAGIVAKTVVAPIDRVKFLFMGTVREFRLKLVAEELSRIRLEEGIRSFWKGNLTQLLRIFPYSGIVFFI